MRASGFTLVELVITLAIAGITLTMAIPAFSSLVHRHQVTAPRDELLRTLYAARSLAILRHHSVTVCPGGPAGCDATGAWERGWLIFEDPDGDEDCQDGNADGRCDLDTGAILRVVPISADAITVRGNHWVRTGVRFNSRGYAGWNNGTLSICHAHVADVKTGIVIAPSGRPRVADARDNIRCPAAP